MWVTTKLLDPLHNPLRVVFGDEHIRAADSDQRAIPKIRVDEPAGDETVAGVVGSDSIGSRGLARNGSLNPLNDSGTVVFSKKELAAIGAQDVNAVEMRGS